MLFSFIIQCPQCNKLLLNEHGDDNELLTAFVDNFSSGDLELIFHDHAKEHAREPDATIHTIAAMFAPSFGPLDDRERDWNGAWRDYFASE